MTRRKSRVAILTNRLLDWTSKAPCFGGGERYALTLARLFQRQKLDVIFFQAGHEAFEGEYYGFPVRALPIGDFFSEFHYGICERFYETTSDFDHVVINVPAYASGRLRDDAILICHGIWFDHENWPLPIRFRTREWFGHLYRAFSQPSRVISVDTNSINVIRSFWPELAPRMRYLPNWVDTKLFQPARRSGQQLTVLFPRRAEVNRGTRILGEILSAIPGEARLVWAGDGEAEDMAILRDLAAGDSRFQVTSATFEEMPALYARADICVIPSVACEGTSLSCLEALASGCAVVATSVGGLPDLIHHNVNGVLAEPNAQSIASAINQLMSDGKLRGRLQTEASRSAENFSLNIWEGRWLEVLNEAGWSGKKAKVLPRQPSATPQLDEGLRLAAASGSRDEAAARIGFLEGQLAQWDRIFAAQQTSLSFLKTAVDSQKQEIANHQGESNFLRHEIANRERILDEHRKTIDEHQKAIDSLKAEMISNRERILEEHRKTNDEHLKTVDFLKAEIRSSQAELDIRQRQLRYLEAHSAQQAEGIEWLRTEIAVRQEKLEKIYHSRMWRTADVYWRSRRAVGRLVKPLTRTFRSAVLWIGRKILPPSMKRYLKRFWDPNQNLTVQEAIVMRRANASLGDMTGERRGDPTLPPAYDLVCWSIIDWSFRWQRPQQMMARFASEGHRVFFLSTTEFLPVGKKRVSVTPLRKNVWEVKIAAPHSINVYGGELPDSTVDYVIGDLEELSSQFNINCAISYVQVPTWAPAAYAARRRFGWKIVYDCMDEWNTFPGMKEPLLEQERRLVRDTDLLIVSAQRLVEKWRSENPGLLLVRNAADYDHYTNAQPSALLNDLPHPIVGYFGAIADWFDLPLMLRLARERPDYTFVLIGGIFNVPMQELESLPNVRVLGQKPYELMPSYLAAFDACIIPFVVNAVTEATDPVKFYEYISLGKPVVAPRMPELFTYSEHLYIAQDHDDFLRKVDLAVRENKPELREARIELARANTWQARVADIKRGVQDAHEKVSVVVVTYYNLDYTRLCVDSLFRNTLYPNLELVIVDNGSTDGTPEYLRARAARHDNVTIVLNERNFGFARANNQGMAASSGRYVVLLNNDTVVPNGWLPRLLRHLKNPELGLVVTVTNFSGNESRIDVPYSNLDEMEEFAKQYTREHEGRIFDLRVAAMYCVGMRREVYEKVGPLDEQFSVGMFEDDDYSHRVRLAGYRVVCAEDAFVHHFGQTSFKKLSRSEYQAIWDRNQQLFERKWGVQWQPHTLRASSRA